MRTILLTENQVSIQDRLKSIASKSMRPILVGISKAGFPFGCVRLLTETGILGQPYS